MRPYQKEQGALLPNQASRRVRCGPAAQFPTAELAATCAVKGNTNAVSDAGVAALLAEAACRGAVYNVRINIAALEDRSRGAGPSPCAAWRR